MEIRVADIMTSPVVTLGADQSLSLAESFMTLARVRHIPVLDGQRVIGLVSHRDLLAAGAGALSPSGAAATLSVPVRRIMRTAVWTIEPAASANTAARLLRDHKIGCLPVVEDGTLVGILTASDLLAVLSDALDLRARPRRLTVADVMTPSPVTVTRGDSIATARSLMSEHRIRHLALVDAGHPSGVLSERAVRVAEAICPRPAEARIYDFLSTWGHEPSHAVSAEAWLDDVLLDMYERRIDATLVVQSTRLVGIFAAQDACRVLALRLRAQHD